MLITADQHQSLAGIGSVVNNRTRIAQVYWHKFLWVIGLARYRETFFLCEILGGMKIGHLPSLISITLRGQNLFKSSGSTAASTLVRE